MISQRELNNNNTGCDYSEIDYQIEKERNREKSIQEKVDDLEEFMVIEDDNNVNKFKPHTFKTDKEWQKYYEYLELQCKLYRLKQDLKINNTICPNCGNKYKKCTCICEDCKKVGRFNCDCLPF